MINKEKIEWWTIVGVLLVVVAMAGAAGYAAGALHVTTPEATLANAEHEYYRGTFDACVGAALNWLGADPDRAISACNKVAAALYEIDAYRQPSPNYVSPITTIEQGE